MSKKLTNKFYKQYDYTCRYSGVPVYHDITNLTQVCGLSSYLDNSTIYRLHTVKQGDTFDNLALYYYNNPTLFWVICSFNRIKDPYMKLVEGSQLKIPSLANIRFDVNGRF